MKLCSGCKTEKQESEFGKNSSKKDGLQTFCKLCKSEYNVKYHADNKDKWRESKSKTRQERRNKLIEFVSEYLHNNECVDCGNKDIRVLEFDHLRDKDFSISSGISDGIGIDLLRKEMAKCEVVCANCHRIRTYERCNSWRICASSSVGRATLS